MYDGPRMNVMGASCIQHFLCVWSAFYGPSPCSPFALTHTRNVSQCRVFCQRTEQNDNRTFPERDAEWKKPCLVTSIGCIKLCSVTYGLGYVEQFAYIRIPRGRKGDNELDNMSPGGNPPNSELTTRSLGDHVFTQVKLPLCLFT